MRLPIWIQPRSPLASRSKTGRRIALPPETARRRGGRATARGSKIWHRHHRRVHHPGMFDGGSFGDGQRPPRLHWADSCEITVLEEMGVPELEVRD